MTNNIFLYGFAIIGLLFGVWYFMQFMLTMGNYWTDQIFKAWIMAMGPRIEVSRNRKLQLEINKLKHELEESYKASGGLVR